MTGLHVNAFNPEFRINKIHYVYSSIDNDPISLSVMSKYEFNNLTQKLNFKLKARNEELSQIKYNLIFEKNNNIKKIEERYQKSQLIYDKFGELISQTLISEKNRSRKLVSPIRKQKVNPAKNTPTITNYFNKKNFTL